jgi:hypothetical protein
MSKARFEHEEIKSAMTDCRNQWYEYTIDELKQMKKNGILFNDLFVNYYITEPEASLAFDYQREKFRKEWNKL